MALFTLLVLMNAFLMFNAMHHRQFRRHVFWIVYDAICPCLSIADIDNIYLLLLPYSHSCFVLIIFCSNCLSFLYIFNYIIFCNAIYIFCLHFVVIKSI
jgi:hypothetical protein